MRLYVVTIGLVFAILVGGIVVDRIYAHFARRHPQLGPFRKNDGGCGCCAAKAACSDRSSCAG